MPTIKMNTHFMIPNNLEELLHDKFDNYVVSNVLSVSDITDWIKGTLIDFIYNLNVCFCDFRVKVYFDI